MTEMAEVIRQEFITKISSLFLFQKQGEFGLWRPSKVGPYVWEVIPSLMPVALLRKGWGFEGDVPVGEFDWFLFFPK